MGFFLISLSYLFIYWIPICGISVSTKILPDTMVKPDAVFQSEEWVVAIYNGKPFLSNEAKIVNSAKDKTVMLKHSVEKNSYGYSIVDNYKITLIEQEIENKE